MADATRRHANVLREMVLPRLDGIRKSGGGFMARCPAHEDGTASLSVAEGREHPVVFRCFAGCAQDDVLAALGLGWADLTTPNRAGASLDSSTWMPCKHTMVASYEYRDAAGNLVFVVARCDRKGNGCPGFRQWRPDPTLRSGRRWSLNLPDGAKAGAGLPYRLPEVLQAMAVEPATPNIWNTEGEKDADRLWKLGLPATCNAEGAGKWTEAHARWLTGADIIVVADRDDRGWAHAEQVVNTLLDVARSIEVVRAAVGKDASDHLNAGLNIAQFVKVMEAKPAPSFAPGHLRHVGEVS